MTYSTYALLVTNMLYIVLLTMYMILIKWLFISIFTLSNHPAVMMRVPHVYSSTGKNIRKNFGSKYTSHVLLRCPVEYQPALTVHQV